MAKAAAAAEERKADDPDEGKPADGGAPLFPRASSDWIAVHVERIDPAEEEGFLGRLPITATEQEIRGRWGGGRYMVRAVNGNNQFKANRTVSIAGDPIFISEVNEQRWRRGLGHRSAGGTPAAPAAAFGLPEIMAVFQGMQQIQAQQQLAFMQVQADQRRQELDERRAAEERRRQEDGAREQARREDEARREDRRAREEEAARARDRDFMKTTIEMINGRPAGGEAGQMQAFITGMTTALKLRPPGGDGGRDDDDDKEDDDPIGETIRGAVRGLVDSIGGRKDAAASSASSAGSPPPEAGPEPVTVTGALGEQVRDFVRKAQGKGKDPNALLAGVIDVASRQLDRQVPANGADVRAAAQVVRAKEGTPAQG